MGVVTDALRDLIANQVDARGVVVWFDPERHYQKVAATLAIDHATVARYDGSFFQLRREIEPMLQAPDPPRLVVYVPLAETQTHDALIELISIGVTMFPGATSLSRNTRLAVLGRQVLRGVVGAAAADAVAKQAEAGQLSLEDLDRLAEQGAGFASGPVSLIFGSTSPTDVALAFLASDQHDAPLAEKEAVGALATLFTNDLGLVLGKNESAAHVRDALARHVLLADFAGAIAGDLPTALQETVERARPGARAACQAVARAWRGRHDLRDSYVARAGRVEQQIGLAAFAFPTEVIAPVETFLAIEEALQQQVEDQLVNVASESLVVLAQTKQASFWSRARPEVQARWALIATAGHLLRQADRVAAGLKRGPTSFRSLVASYAEGDQPWCLLDTYQRHLERRVAGFDFDLDGRHRTLQQLIARARQSFAAVGSDLASAFVERYAEEDFQSPGLSLQRAVFSTKVKPLLGGGKVAYVLVDAFRFEMAREFVLALGEPFEGTIEPGLGVLPGVTEIGMAALMPGADGDFALVENKAGKLVASIEGSVVSNRRERLDLLNARVTGKVFDCKIEDLLALKKTTRASLEGADLIVVTSQEIDSLCEGDHIALARSAMDDVLRDLRRALRVLAGLGVQSFVIAADHGYLFGEELESDLKVDPPGGQTIALHRRVWVGRGGTADPAYLRTTATDLGLGGSLEIALPRGFAGFKVPGGASAYFHGGLSPQETIVPVATVTAPGRPTRAAESEIVWQLRAGSKKITTRFFSVEVSGIVAALWDVAPPRVRLEMRGLPGSVATPVSASYGFDDATGDVQLRLIRDGDARAVEPNTVALMLTGDIDQDIDDSSGKQPSKTPSVVVRLVDAGSGNELARLDPIEVALSL